MIEVIRNGKDKTYLERCGKCGTDMTYQLDDVQEKQLDGRYSFTYIVCPVCGHEVGAMLRTEENIKQNPGYLYPTYSSFAIGGGGCA